MGFFAGMTVCFSSVFATEGLLPCLVCLGVSLVTVRGCKKAPRPLIPLFLVSAFLRMLPLGRVLTEELENRGMVLLALGVTAAVGLSFLGQGRLCRAFLPCGLLLLPLLGFCMAGEWSVPVFEAIHPVSLFPAVVCPLSGMFLLPEVKNRIYTPLGMLVGGAFGVLLSLVSFPVWEGTAGILAAILCAAMELGMLWKSPAYTSYRRDEHAAAKRDSSGNRPGG